MPYRTSEVLRAWLVEFQELGYDLDDNLRVIEQDGDRGENTGLIALRLRDAGTSAYIQPVRLGSHQWVVTFEARDEPVEMTAAAVAQLSCELALISTLCAFLQAKSISTRPSPTHI